MGKLPYNAEVTARNVKRVQYRPARAINPDVPARMDASLHKAVHTDLHRRYDLLSEFVHDLSQPNESLINNALPPLLERNPVAFVQTLARGLLILNVTSLLR